MFIDVHYRHYLLIMLIPSNFDKISYSISIGLPEDKIILQLLTVVSGAQLSNMLIKGCSVEFHIAAQEIAQ